MSLPLCVWLGWNAFLFRVVHVSKIKESTVSGCAAHYKALVLCGRTLAKAVVILSGDYWLMVGVGGLSKNLQLLKRTFKKIQMRIHFQRQLKTGIFGGVECGRREKKSKEIDPLPHGMWFESDWRWKSGLCNLHTVGKALEATFDKQSRTYPEIAF